MPAKPAPSKPRQLVTEGRNVTPKIAALLSDPALCTRVAAAWPSVEKVVMAVIFDIPQFCKKNDLDASATVLAANKILTTLEVIKDQAELDRTK